MAKLSSSMFPWLLSLILLISGCTPQAPLSGPTPPAPTPLWLPETPHQLKPSSPVAIVNQDSRFSVQSVPPAQVNTPISRSGGGIEVKGYTQTSVWDSDTWNARAIYIKLSSDGILETNISHLLSAQNTAGNYVAVTFKSQLGNIPFLKEGSNYNGSLEPSTSQYRSGNNYGSGWYHHLSGDVNLKVVGGTLEVTFNNLTSPAQQWDECYSLPTRVLCYARSDASKRVEEGSVTFKIPNFVSSHPITLDVSPEYISPNGDGAFDTATFEVKAANNMDWTLKVEGKLPGEPDDRGYPTQGEACTWEKTGKGTGEPQNITWDGSCGNGKVVDGNYPVILTAPDSSNKEVRSSINVDLTPPEISKPHIENELEEGGTEFRVSYTIEDPAVNGVASGLANDIQVTGNAPYPEVGDVNIEMLGSHQAKVTLALRFPEGQFEVSSLQDDFSIAAVTSRSQIVPKDKVRNQKAKRICGSHPTGYNKVPARPYSPPDDQGPSTQACSSGLVKLMTVLDNDTSGPDLTFVFGVDPNKGLMDFGWNQDDKKRYEALFEKFRQSKVRVSLNQGSGNMKLYNICANPNSKTTDPASQALAYAFELDGTTFVSNSFSSSPILQSFNNLRSYLQSTNQHNVHYPTLIGVGVNLHNLYSQSVNNKGQIRPKSAQLDFSYDGSSFMKLNISMGTDGRWAITCS